MAEGKRVPDDEAILDRQAVCPHRSGTREYEEWWENHFKVVLPLWRTRNAREAAERKARSDANYGHDFYTPHGDCECGQKRTEFRDKQWEAERRGSDLPPCPLTEGPVFYLDCFVYCAMLGDRFPVSTYGPSTWAKLLWLRAKIGDNFDRTDIVRETLGQGPLEEEYWPDSDRPR